MVLRLALASFVLAGAGCSAVEDAVDSLPVVGGYADGRLDARLGTPSVSPTGRGRHELEIEGERALLYVPSGVELDRPAPFALLLHGASGHAEAASGSGRRSLTGAGRSCSHRSRRTAARGT
jgi:poly(3-hydroxybutyrate) depolymerase